MRRPAIALLRLRYTVFKKEFVREFILSMLAVVRVFFQSRSDTALEVLALVRSQNPVLTLDQ